MTDSVAGSGGVGLYERLGLCGQDLGNFVRHGASSDRGQSLTVLDAQVGDEVFLECTHFVRRYGVNETLTSDEDDGDLLFDRLRYVLTLLENLNELLTTGELALRSRIEVRTKLREGFELAILSEVETGAYRKPSSWP